MSRTPVVMIHGAFCGGWAFERWRALYESHDFEVHTPTLRHHEPSSVGAELLGRTSLRDYASDLADLVDTLGAAPVLVGHSLGGLLAQMLAALKPVRALVLLAPSAPWGMLPSTPFEFFSAQALYLDGPFWSRPLAPRRWVAEASMLDVVPEAERAAILARLVPESGLATFETMHWMLDAARASHVDARAVVCPILCLVGAQDRITPPSTVRRLARRYHGRARFEELPRHSHWLIGEAGWEKIATGSLAWLDQVLDRNEVRTPSRT